MKKLFGKINMNWKKVIIFSVAVAIYTALINQVSFLYDTSFRDIAISFEWWILFAIIIIMNSKNNLDSALKTFVFFLISQPLIYLIEVPFLGIEILNYYKNWIVPTILTLPMAFIGHYMKKDNIFGLIILSPMLVFLSIHSYNFLENVIFDFPHHFISLIFCISSMFIYVMCIFKKRYLRVLGSIFVCILLIIIFVLAYKNPHTYNLILKCEEEDLPLNENWKVYLENKSLGKVYIDKEKSLDDYCVFAEFKKTGKTKLILETPSEKIADVNISDKKIFDITIKNNDYEVEENKISKDKKQEYDSIRKRINEELSFYLKVKYPTCEENMAKQVITDEDLINLGAKQDLFLDVDNKNYCDSVSYISCIGDNKIFFETYLGCKNFRENKFFDFDK